MFSRTGSTALEERLPSLMSRARFLHSKATAETSVSLALQFKEQLDSELCYRTGLLHDIAREWKGVDLVSYAKEHHLQLEQEEQENPVLLHAVVGADYLGSQGFEDELCLAVRYHTLGSIAMGRLGLVLFIADYIEPGRKHLTDEMRKSLRGLSSLEMVCLEILNMEEPYLQKKGIALARCSQDLMHFLAAGKVL